MLLIKREAAFILQLLSHFILTTVNTKAIIHSEHLNMECIHLY